MIDTVNTVKTDTHFWSGQNLTLRATSQSKRQETRTLKNKVLGGSNTQIHRYIYRIYTHTHTHTYRCLQMNGAVSTVNKKFISHLTRAQRTPSAAATVPSLSCATSSSLARAYCGAEGPVSKMASQQEKAFCVLRFEVSRSLITVQREFRARFRKDAQCMVQ